MKQGINTNKLPYAKRVERHKTYNKPTAEPTHYDSSKRFVEVLAAADKAILVQKLKSALKHGFKVPMSLVAALNDQDYEDISGLVDALMSKQLIDFSK